MSNKIAILIDDSIAIEEVLKGIQRHAFYPFKIDNKEVIVELNDEGFYFEKDLYIDSISMKTGYHIDKGKIELQKKVDIGLFNYLLSNIKAIILKSCLITALFILDSLLPRYKDSGSIFELESLVPVFVGAIIIFSSYFIYDWFVKKYSLKKWDSLYHRL